MTDYQHYLAAAAKRRADAWKLYKRGKSMTEIGTAIGVTRARAHQIVKAERERRRMARELDA